MNGPSLAKVVAAIALVTGAAAPAAAQDAPAAFAQFKRVLESVRTTFSNGRATTHKVAGKPCAPKWTQKRADPDGSDAVAENMVFNWSEVSNVRVSYGDVEFTTLSEGTIAIAMPSAQKAQEVQIAMETLRKACAG